MKRPAKSALSFFDKPVSFVKNRIKSLFFVSSGLRDESVCINVNRIYYFSIIAIPAHILLIALFGFSNPDLSPLQLLWRRGVTYTHSALLFLFVACFWITSSLRKKKRLNVSRLLQYALIVLIMAAGIALTCIDQLITTNITPYLIICVLIGVVFLIRPLIALPLYLASFISFYFSIAWNSPSPDVLLSNRANGLALAAIGFAISVIMWQNQSVNEEQKRCIERQKSALEQLAYTDPLTGLSNRRFFNELVEKEIVTSRDKAYDSCIIVIDIDNFKRINDAHGHPFGDAVLRQFAYLLQDELRARDTVSRMGGEEFIILLSNSSLEKGEAIAQRLRTLVENHEFIVGSSSVRITASFGVSLLNSSEKYGFFNSYGQADKALYIAKINGKNRVEIAD